MSVPDAEKPPSIPKRQSGVKTVLRYTGIPPSWLDKKPKLPSRNWLIFLSVTSSVAGLYFYDRHQCKKIRQEYIDKVKHLSEVPIDPFDSPRKVTVYGAKWPADEEWNLAIKYFRKYVKPILVAAAVDYELVPGKRHGEITKRVAEDIRMRRRFDAGLEEDAVHEKVLPTYKPAAERQRRALEGGVVIVGRPTFKEYMEGLKRGWTDGLEKVDRDEELARILENDTHFDEPEDPRDAALGGDDDGEPAVPVSKPLSHQNSPVFSPLQMRGAAPSSPSSSSSSSRPAGASPAQPQAPPAAIPLQPPILFVPFLNYIGISQIPLMIWGFFNQRHKVLSGAQAGYALVENMTRPIEVPTEVAPAASEFIQPTETTTDEKPSAAAASSSSSSVPAPLGDLDFDKNVESYYKSSLSNYTADIEKARAKYYEALPAKLATARELARGTREPTKEELENPPPTEVELRAERLKKERRWRDDVEGWEIINPQNPVAWDERFRSALRVFVTPSSADDEESSKTS